MQDITDGGMPAPSGERDEMHRAVVLELASVIEHIRKSRRLIERAIASDAAEEAAPDNVVVLDDVTPGYERVDAALRQCEAGLGVTLRLLQGPAKPGDAAGEGGPPRAQRPISA